MHMLYFNMVIQHIKLYIHHKSNVSERSSKVLKAVQKAINDLSTPAIQLLFLVCKKAQGDQEQTIYGKGIIAQVLKICRTPGSKACLKIFYYRY